jgi:hypothetical protein
MAKRRSEVVKEKAAAEALEEPAIAVAVPVEEPAAEPAAEAMRWPPTMFVRIEMPVGDPSNYASDHLELRLRGKEIEALDRLWQGCRRENVYLSDGRRVESRPDVVRLIFERFAEHMET